MVFVPLLFGCATVAPPDPATADRDVYAAVFDSAVGPQPERPPLTVRDRTAIAQEWVSREDVRRVLPEASDRLIDDFFARSAAEHPLPASALAGVTNLKIEMIGDAELKRMFASEFLDQEWQRFRETHGGARSIVNLSAVGYDEATHTALVYMDAGCGATCGAAYLFLLEKRDRAWRVKETRLLWAS